MFPNSILRCDRRQSCLILEYVREMALSADLACKVYHGQGLDYQDNKLERLNQIQRIRDRLVKDRR